VSSLLLLLACLAAGFVVARLARPPATLASSLNWWAMNVALVALILELTPRLPLRADLWFPVAAMWFIFLGGWSFFAVIGRWLRWSRARIGALTLTCGLGNTAFIGFPLIEALRGKDALQLAVVTDQVGTFVALAVGGGLVAALYSGTHATAASIARKVLFFPPFVSLILGTTVGLLGGWPDIVDTILARIGATLTPITLFAVGLQLRMHLDRDQLIGVSTGIAWKMVLAPLLIFGAGTFFMLDRPILHIATLEGAMAPMVSAAILADQHGLEPRLANTVLAVGTLLSFVTVPIVSMLLGS
jgi:predicted permease